MFKILKEEMLFIPLMMILLEVFRTIIFNFYPETALFDRGSELETFILSVWQLTWITSVTWLLLRVVFPPAFKSLKAFYNRFETFTDEYKESFSMKLFLVFFFGLVFLMSGKSQTSEIFLRKKLTDTLHSQLYVRELTGNNDGVDVERYLKFVGLSKGYAWCAAFTSYNLAAVGVSSPPNPKTAWAPAFADPKYVVWSQALIKQHKGKSPRPGDCFTLYYAAYNRIGHVGFIVGQTDNYFITVEGNTGPSSSLDGSGVHKLKRQKNKVHTVANYITPYLSQHEKQAFIIRLTYSLNELPSQNYGITYRSLDRKHTGLCLGEGFHRLQGFTFENKRLHSYHKRYSNTRQRRKGEPAGDKNRDAATASNRINYRWKDASELCLQRPGVKAKNEGALYQKARIKKRHKAIRKDYLQGKGSPIYT